MVRFVLVLALTAGGLVLLPAGMAGAADAVVSMPCSEAEFDAALATVQGSGGGLITFDCGGAASITFSAEKVIDSDVRIDGADLITLSGGDVTRHFLVVEGGSLSVERLVLEDGYADDGGAVLIEDGGALNVVDSTLRGNRADDGGALSFDSAIIGVDATISGSTLVENEAFNGSGGAINIAGGAFGASTGATVTISDSLLADNFATDQGGAIYNDGGAFDTTSGGTLTISGSSLLRNVTEVGGGGAIFNGGGAFNESTGGSLTIISSTLADNVDGSGGGALFNGGGAADDSAGGSVVIRRSSIVGNRTFGSGGALFNNGGATDNATGGAVQITNSTISGNVADDVGGAIFNNAGVGIDTTGGSVTVLASTITQNDSLSGDGDGLFNSDAGSTLATVELRLSIVAENDPSGGGQECDGTIISTGFNLDSDGTCQLISPNDVSGGSADLGPLADNGGPTETHLPGANSDALDAGPASCLAFDQRDLPRPGGANCDIGAVEVQPVVVQPVTLCVSRFTARVYTFSNGSCDPASYYEVVMPSAAPQTFCIDPATGALSHVAGGVCPGGRTVHTTPADGDLLTCVSLFTGQHRAVVNHSQCIAGSENPLVIPA
jgi:hypothetical protein